MHKNERQAILRNFFDINFIRNYSIKEKLKFFNSFPSDFDVVYLNVSVS